MLILCERCRITIMRKRKVLRKRPMTAVLVDVLAKMISMQVKSSYSVVNSKLIPVKILLFFDGGINVVVELLLGVVDEGSDNSSENNEASRSNPHVSESMDVSVQKSHNTRLDNVGSDVGNCAQCRGVLRSKSTDECRNILGLDTRRDDNLGDVRRKLDHLVAEQGIVDGDADSAAKRSNADNETAGNGDELRRNRQLRDSNQSGQGHAEGQTHEDRVAPDGLIAVTGACSHADEEGDEDHKRKDRDPSNSAGNGAIQTSHGGTDNGADEHDAVASAHNKCIVLVKDRDLEIDQSGSQRRSSDRESTYLKREIGVGCEEGNALGEDTEQGQGEVAVVGEEAVVEHAILLEPRLIHDEANSKSKTDGKGGRHVGVGPWVRGMRPGQTNTEEYQTGGEEEVADPIELLQLLTSTASELLLLLSGRRVIGNDSDESTDNVPCHGHVEVVAEAIGSWVVGAVESTANEETSNGSQAVGDHVCSLAPGSVSSGKNLRRDGVEERLRAKGNASDSESSDGHIHRASPRNDD